MILERKDDAEAIRTFIKSLKAQSWLGPARAWWPDYLFRVDSIDAAARILNGERLLSRTAALRAGVMIRDSASPDVIAATPERWKQFVRLYFRPRTPTQFRNEGFRPTASYALGAHCPVPIVMLFDANEILTRASTIYSDGNLAAGAATGTDLRFLSSIPFQKVYHDSWLDEAEKRSIIFHRHAEAIAPDELDLSPLRFIGCRTQAEFETLIQLLEPEARERWAGKLGLGMKLNLHYRRWTFVEEAELTSSCILFKFNPSTTTPGPFRCVVAIQEDVTGKNYRWEDRSFSANSSLRINLSSLTYPHSYTVRLEFDEQIAYMNHYEADSLPF